MPVASIDILAEIGRELEQEVGRVPSAWTRYTIDRRIAAVISAENRVWGAILAPYEVADPYGNLPTNAIERFVTQIAPGYIVKATEAISNGEINLPAYPRIRLLITVEIEGVPARIVAADLLQTVLDDEFLQPLAYNPVAVLRGEKIHLFPESLSGNVVVRYIKYPTWFDEGVGTVAEEV